MSWCCEGQLGNHPCDLDVEDVGECTLEYAELFVYCPKCQRQGTWTLYDRWFEEHVYTIIVNRSHVPKSVLKVFIEKNLIKKTCLFLDQHLGLVSFLAELIGLTIH